MEGRELAQKIVRLCQKKGAEQAEALVINQREKAVTAFNEQIQISGSTDVTRLTVRLIRDHKGAIISARGSSERALEEMVDRALASSQNGSPDKFLGPADSENVGRASGELNIFDERLAKISLSNMEEIALAAESAVVKKDPRTTHFVTATFQVQTQTVSLCTSQGFVDSYEGTTSTLQMSAVMDNFFNEVGGRGSQSEELRLTGGASSVARSLDGIDIEKAAGRTIGQITSTAGSKRSLAGSFPVVFAPGPARRIATTLIQFSSGLVASLLAGTGLRKIGEPICSAEITLIDDATRAGGMRTAPFDHEGISSRRKVLIEKGILREYLLNSYYGRVLERNSTGNAAANDDVRFSVSPSNAYIEPGPASLDSIIGDIRQGLYVKMFLSPTVHLTNFTQPVAGVWIENGKLTYPVRAATISAPLDGMLKNIVAVGNEAEGNTAITSPTLMIGKMNVTPLL
jgi:PmbA protein